MNACCMFVPYTRSNPGAVRSSRLQPPRVVAEPDQVERVVRVAALDQRVQRQRHLLRVDEVPAQRHREREIEQQGGRRLGALLRLDHLEVVGDEAHLLAGRRPRDRVEHRALHRELAVVAEVPWTGRAGRLGQTAGVASLVRALAVALQLLEDLRERAFPELARPTRRDLEASPAPLHETGLLEHALDLLQPTEVLSRGVPERAAHGVLVDVVDRRPRIVAVHRPVEVLVVVESFHRVDRSRHRHSGSLAVPLADPHPLALAPRHLRERLLQVRAQAVDLEREVHVLHHLLG